MSFLIGSALFGLSANLLSTFLAISHTLLSPARRQGTVTPARHQTIVKPACRESKLANDAEASRRPPFELPDASSQKRHRHLVYGRHSGFTQLAAAEATFSNPPGVANLTC